MALGTLTYRLTDLTMSLLGSTIAVTANVSKWIENDLGQNITDSSFAVTHTYPVAGFTAKTISQIQADLIADAKAQNAALSGKTIT